jgi:ferredoxin-type protein NapH
MKAGKYLVLRRASQLGILALFLLGPLAGIWIVKGTLTFSYALDTLPLADPYVLAQSLLALHRPEQKMLIGAALIVAFYLLVGGRVYCSWVCPMNMVTDAAAWLRQRLGLRMGSAMPRSLRYWILAMTLILALATGTIAWELVNPVSMLHRGLVFGMGAAWAIVAAVFLLDVFVSPRAWCGHTCPVGAFYSLIGRFSLLRVAAVRRAQCNDCMDCYAVCPEPQVITPALKGEARGAGPVILSPACTNCARCIDVCTRDVFEFGTRFGNTPGKTIQLAEAKELQ